MAKTDPEGIVVSDAGPLIHLDELESFDLLYDFKNIMIPLSVWKEACSYRMDLNRRLHTNIKIIEKINITNQISSIAKLFTLHKGEIDAIALLVNNENSIYFTDDSAARIAASSLNFEVHGTIGILIRSVRRGQRSSADIISIIESIPVKSSLYIKKSLIESTVKLLKIKFNR